MGNVFDDQSLRFFFIILGHILMTKLSWVFNQMLMDAWVMLNKSKSAYCLKVCIFKWIALIRGFLKDWTELTERFYPKKSILMHFYCDLKFELEIRL